MSAGGSAVAESHPGEDQPVLRARHAHVEQPPPFLQVGVARQLGVLDADDVYAGASPC